MRYPLVGITATRQEKSILHILAYSYFIFLAARNIRETQRRHSADCSSSRLLNLIHYSVIGVSSLCVLRVGWRLTS